MERYNRTVRYDWLSQYIFTTIEEVQEAATKWLWTYNNERPNMAIGGITPMQKLAMSSMAAQRILLLEPSNKGGITHTNSNH